MSETRVGRAFGNPDRVSRNGWGSIVTPDELRYLYLFGFELEAVNGHAYTDDMLTLYIDMATGIVEHDLSFHFLPRKYRCRTTRFNEPRTDIPNGEEFEWDDPYDYRVNQYTHYMYIPLRHRPLLKLHRVLWKDPLGNTVRDILEWAKPNYRSSSIEFYPTGSLGSIPILTGSAFPFIIPGVLQGWRDYPDAFMIDYEVGFESAEKVWRLHRDIYEVIGRLAAINLLNDYGDGRTASLASASIGLSGISESYSTTMSATNAMFGARILTWQKELKDWWIHNKVKYTGILVA